MHEPNTAILHIGLPKTGTTSIQRFLWTNQTQLEDAGIVYPSFLQRYNHLELAVYAVGEEGVRMAGVVGIRDLESWLTWKPAFRDLFIRETSRSGRFIFSSEHMASRLLTVDRVEELRSLLFETFDDVHVLMYVRRQDEMAASSFSTFVRDGGTSLVDVESVKRERDRYDFRRIVTRWQEVFGESKVSVRLYPRFGGEFSLLEDFARALDLGDLEDWERPPRLNPSLSAAELEFLRRFNSLVPRLDTKRHRISGVGNPVKFVEGTLGGVKWRLSAEDSMQIMAHFEKSNQWILDRVENPEIGSDYFSVASPDSEDGTGLLKVSAEDAIAIAARIWGGLETANADLRRLGEPPIEA